MYKKKLISLALAALLPISLSLAAEESAGQADESSPAEMPAADTVAPAMAQKTMDDDLQERLRMRNEHYQDLRKRAEAMGVILPESPPWASSGMQMVRPSMEERMRQHEKMMNMTPEERDAERQAHYQEMQERAKAMGVELPQTPPWEQRQAMMDEAWAKQQAVIDGMTDEERAACHAMHRRHMGMMMDNNQRPMMPGYGMGPGMGQGMGPGMMGPGYGYGPAPYGPQNYWAPNQ